MGQIGGGQIEIKIREIKRDFILYTQADGEFFKLLNPRSIKIQLADWLAQGSINVLRRNANWQHPSLPITQVVLN